MKFEWDENKARINKAKHGVDFERMERFEFATALIEIDDDLNCGEERWRAVGFIGSRLFTVIFIEQDEVYRIISLRKPPLQKNTAMPTASKPKQPSSPAEPRLPRGIAEARGQVTSKQRADAKRRAMEALEGMTYEEDDDITRGALWDPDSPLLEEIEARRAGWLPRGKRLAPVKLDQDVIDFFVKDGPGWHERINAALRKAAGLE